ncbi:MAG: peptidase C13 [Arenimonas sp.]|nr:peptidase C13 [Arenimonas sp.]
MAAACGAAQAKDLRKPASESLPSRTDESLLRDIAALAPQRPGQADLFVLGVAGDGTEQVFLNEVQHLRALAAQRLDAGERVLLLANHDTAPLLRRLPLATPQNLAAALVAIGAAMDTDEDLLLLYITTHGTPEHELLLRRPDVDDHLLAAPELRQMLDQSGIRHRVLAISACFSGGLLPALRSPDTLVVTAARSDRASFGCGSESAATYFGRAWLVDGLNATVDFAQAFDQARTAIEQRERLEDQEPSLPQLQQGARIADRLAQWRRGFQPGPALPFAYADPASPALKAAKAGATAPRRPAETASGQ